MESTNLKSWQMENGRAGKGLLDEVKELSPEPLFESAPIAGGRLCLACGENPAHTALRTPTRPEPVVPLCRRCSADWNIYGYGILKKIRPLPLTLRIARWCLLHPLQGLAAWGDLQRLNHWQKKMAGIRKKMKEMGR